MNIEIPKQFMGRPIAGAMERLFEEDSQPSSKKSVATPKYTKSVNGFVYVPTIGKLVTDHRILLGKSYNDAQAKIINTTEDGRKLSIPTPLEFREFLKYLRDSQESKDQDLFKDITEVRDPYRANWLNARFDKRKDGLYLVSENVLINGQYKKQEQKLTDFVKSDKAPGISLDDWIDSDAPHGLPKAKTATGNLYYWAPTDKRVAGFYANSGGANLCCNGDPSYANDSLGVFACAEGAGRKN
jgi:hypothetical protein